MENLDKSVNNQNRYAQNNSEPFILNCNTNTIKKENIEEMPDTASVELSPKYHYYIKYSKKIYKEKCKGSNDPFIRSFARSMFDLVQLYENGRGFIICDKKKAPGIVLDLDDCADKFEILKDLTYLDGHRVWVYRSAGLNGIKIFIEHFYIRVLTTTQGSKAKDNVDISYMEIADKYIKLINSKYGLDLKYDTKMKFRHQKTYGNSTLNRNGVFVPVRLKGSYRVDISTMDLENYGSVKKLHSIPTGYMPVHKQFFKFTTRDNLKDMGIFYAIEHIEMFHIDTCHWENDKLMKNIIPIGKRNNHLALTIPTLFKIWEQLNNDFNRNLTEDMLRETCKFYIESHFEYTGNNDLSNFFGNAMSIVTDMLNGIGNYKPSKRKNDGYFPRNRNIEQYFDDFLSLYPNSMNTREDFEYYLDQKELYFSPKRISLFFKNRGYGRKAHKPHKNKGSCLEGYTISETNGQQIVTIPKDKVTSAIKVYCSKNKIKIVRI